MALDFKYESMQAPTDATSISALRGALQQKPEMSTATAAEAAATVGAQQQQKQLP